MEQGLGLEDEEAGTAACLPMLQTIGADIMESLEPEEMSCKNQPMFPKCPLKSQSTNEVLCRGDPSEAGASLSYRPLLPGMARPLYQDRAGKV